MVVTRAPGQGKHKNWDNGAQPELQHDAKIHARDAGAVMARECS
eukprot:COSAG05_NODE_291_length_12036_cov_15.352266_8_plen_44_part_00